MYNKLLVIVLLGVLFSCSNKRQTNTFTDLDPKTGAIFRSKTKKLYYVIDSILVDTINFGTFNHVKGDTIAFFEYDSLGRICYSKSYPAFCTTTNYHYDHDGNLTYKRIMSDFLSEYFLATFIDTIKRIKYIKEVDVFDDYPYGMTYFNQNGLPDSALSFTLLQTGRSVYKEYYKYKNDTLILTCKKAISSKDNDVALTGGIMLLWDSIRYFYNHQKLQKIEKTEMHQFNNTFTEVEYFDENERLVFSEYKNKWLFIRYRTIINTL